MGLFGALAREEVCGGLSEEKDDREVGVGRERLYDVGDFYRGYGAGGCEEEVFLAVVVGGCSEGCGEWGCMVAGGHFGALLLKQFAKF